MPSFTSVSFPNMPPSAHTIGSTDPRQMVFYQKNGTRYVVDGDDFLAITPDREQLNRKFIIREMSPDERREVLAEIQKAIDEKKTGSDALKK
jgi:hypothetical protein